MFSVLVFLLFRFLSMASYFILNLHVFHGLVCPEMCFYIFFAAVFFFVLVILVPPHFLAPLYRFSFLFFPYH